MNGFGLHMGDNHTVKISYTDPETGVLQDTVTLPTNTTMQSIAAAVEQMNESLKLIEESQGVTV